MNTLIIQHEPESQPARFRIVRASDNKSAPPAEVVSPIGFPVEGSPDSDLARELRWYLEDFLEYPFEPNTDRADRILDALKKWGMQAFSDLFGSREAGRFFDQASDQGYKNLRLRVSSDDPQILQWPWEALKDPQASYISIDSRIERKINNIRDPLQIAEGLPKNRINILLVTARPFENDAGNCPLRPFEPRRPQ